MINWVPRHPSFASAVAAAAALLQFGLSAVVHGETIVVGGNGAGSRAWDQSFSSVSFVDFLSNPGHVQPAQTGPEDNLSLKLVERGGTITSPNARVVLEVSQANLNTLLKRMVDGTSQAFEMNVANATGIIFRVDLGERFGVNRIRFYPKDLTGQDFLKGYQISLNDGSEEQQTVSGTPDLKVLRYEERNLDPLVDIAIPLQFVRYLEVKQLVRGAWDIDEFEIYGEGFASTAAYTSVVFDQRLPAVFGNLEWAMTAIGEAGDVRATLATRTGTTPDPADSLAWSRWSPPYEAGKATPITSPAPRRYWQFRIDLKSSGILSAGSVDSVAVEVSPATADSLVAEVWPQSATIGETTDLHYWVRSFNSRGFDRLQISTQAQGAVVRSVQIDSVEVAWNRAEVEDGLEVTFPRITGNHLLHVQFESIALRYNTVFAGKVLDSSRPNDLPQALVPGDATGGPFGQGDDLSVAIRVVDRTIHRLRVAPAPFTPNGDGVNDQTTITYDIANLTDAAPLTVEVLDLSGRLVRRVESGSRVSGRFSTTWDGADDRGRRLPPGVYLVRVQLDADTGSESRTALVPLVY